MESHGSTGSQSLVPPSLTPTHRDLIVPGRPVPICMIDYTGIAEEWNQETWGPVPPRLMNNPLFQPSPGGADVQECKVAPSQGLSPGGPSLRPTANSNTRAP